MLPACLAIASLWLSALAAQGATARPEVVGPGVLSSGEVYRDTFTADGATLYFFEKTGSGENYRIFSYRPVPGHTAADEERWKGWRSDVRIAGGGPEARHVDVRYVANSGMLVAVAGRRFLIDAPIRDGIPPYATSSSTERALLETARAPYAGVDAILVTHWHEDHFSAEAVAAHLASSPRTILISSPEVVDRVRTAAPTLPASRLRGVLPMPGRSEPVDVGGLTVHVLRIRHNHTRRLPEQHVGFLIGGASPVLHVGDADPTADNFTLLTSLPQIDVAFLPFWYVSDAGTRRMVADTIRPRRVVAMHIPPADVSKVGGALPDGGRSPVMASSPGSVLDLGQ